MKKKGKLKRDQHLGLVVEPAMHKELTRAAEARYTTLSSLCYGILKDWLGKQKQTGKNKAVAASK